jgi:membrane-associated phospholipid phosphatase
MLLGPPVQESLRLLTSQCPSDAWIGASVIVALLCGVRPAAAQQLAFDLTHPSDVEASSTFVPASLGPITFETLPVTLDVSGRDGDQDKLPEPTKRTRGFFSALYHNVVDDVKHLPRRNSIYFLAGGGALALAVHPIDHSFNAHLEGSGAVGTLFAPGQYVGATEVQMSVAFVTYVVGRMHNQPRAEHIGMDMLEAQILAEGIVEVTKEIVRRPRPTNPDGTPTASGYSFPSGHAAATFATATVFQQHFGWKWAVPTYAIATYVAASRLHLNVHFASDVVMGATTGIIIGRSVTWHGRNDFRIGVVGVPGGLGGRVTW